MPEIWNWFCPPLSVHVSYSRFRDMERLIVFEYLRWKLTILADSGCGLNLTTHMAKRANITTHTTVLSRDSLPTDGYTIPVNKIASQWRQILAPTLRSKYSQSVAGNKKNVSTGTPLRTHTTVNKRLSF